MPGGVPNAFRGGTPLMRRLGLASPIILAPMAGASTPELVSSVSNAGGLGMFGTAGMAAETLRDNIQQIKLQLTESSTPYGVNLFVPSGFLRPEAQWNGEQKAAVDKMRRRYAALGEELKVDTALIDAVATIDHWALFEEQVIVLVQERVPIVSFHFGWPPEGMTAPLKAVGSFLIGCATSVKEATCLASWGAQAIIAQGSEAGGHQGTFLDSALTGTSLLKTPPDKGDIFRDGADDYRRSAMVGMASLVPTLTAAVDVPVIAAGGIMNGAGVIAAMTLGAEAVQMGTAFLACPESAVPDFHKKALLDGCGLVPTVMTQAYTGKPARGLLNAWAAELDDTAVALPNCYNSMPEARPTHEVAAAKGREDIVPLWAGQAYALCKAEPAGEVVNRVVAEAKEILSGRG